MKKLGYFLLTIIPLISFSQEINYSIRGKAKTPDGYLPSGNVMALNPKDSTLIKGAFFYEGDFELNDLTNQEILIKLSSLEFNDTFISIKYLGDSMMDLGEIRVQNLGDALDEVVLKARKPVYKQKSDGTIEVLIENTTLATSNSTNEILSKSPDIIMDDGVISVFGKGRAILYLNGKRITDDQLALISPSNIKKIEIIRNPSSRYDAEGAAVVNISTIKNIGDGYQVGIKQNVSYSDFGGTISYSSLNLDLNKGRFSSNSYYALQLGKERELLHTTRDRDDENVFLQTDLTTDWRREFENYSYYGSGLQYTNDDNSYVSLEYSGFSEGLGGSQLSNNEITNSSNTSFFESDIDRDEKVVNNSISLNYNKAIDTLGTELFFGGQYSNFNADTDNFILEENTIGTTDSSRFLKNLLNLDIDIFSGQLDYKKVFKNESSLEVGTRYSYVNNESDLDFLVSNDNSNFVIDNDLSNSFGYKESIGASYFSFQGILNKKINYVIGVRGEFTNYDLDISSLDEDELIEDDYFNFFPNFSANTKLSENNTLNFAYSSRINRPAYQALNPVLIYQDPFTSIQGNPELIPEITHAFELSSTTKKTTYKIGYNYTLDPIDAAALRGEAPNSYVLKRINLDKRHVFFTSISRTFSNKWFSSNNTISLSYTDIIDNQFDFESIDSKPNIYFYSNNRFNITDTFNAEILFWYLGDKDYGIYQDKERYNLTASIDKSFLNNSLKCTFTANDIFHSIIASGRYNVGQTEIYYNRRWSTNYFRLSVSYNFGKLKKASYKNKTTGDSETRRAQ